MKKHFLSDILLTLFILVALLTACKAGSDRQPRPSDIQVKIQLGQQHNIEYAGFYMAADEGFFADEGLFVELLEGGNAPSGDLIDPIVEVDSGRADFGVVNADLLLATRTTGTPVVAIATIYQRSPLAFISLADKNIRRPEDLVGVTIGVDRDSSSGLVLFAMLDEKGIAPADLRLVHGADLSNDLLIDGEVDVLDAYITRQLVELEMQGYDINAILVSDYGFDVYPNVIFTTEDNITNRPELVESFLRATVHGMQSMIAEPEQAAILAMDYNDAYTRELATEQISRSLPLVNPIGSVPGMMNEEGWLASKQVAEGYGIVYPIDINDAYTLTFLNAIYAGE